MGRGPPAHVLRKGKSAVCDELFLQRSRYTQKTRPRVPIDRSGILAVRRNDGRLAQLVRAPALQAGGRRFESCTAHQLPSKPHYSLTRLPAPPIVIVFPHSCWNTPYLMQSG